MRRRSRVHTRASRITMGALVPLVVMQFAGCPDTNPHALKMISDVENLGTRNQASISMPTLAAPGERFNIEVRVSSSGAVEAEDVEVVVEWDCAFGGGSGQAVVSLVEASLTSLTGMWSGLPQSGGNLTCVDGTGQRRPVQYTVRIWRKSDFSEPIEMQYDLNYREANVR